MRLRAQNSDLSKVEIKKLNRQLRPLIAVLVVMVLSLLVMLGVLSLPHLFPWMMERMGEGGALQGASSVRRLLECCRIWYLGCNRTGPGGMLLFCTSGYRPGYLPVHLQPQAHEAPGAPLASGEHGHPPPAAGAGRGGAAGS